MPLIFYTATGCEMDEALGVVLCVLEELMEFYIVFCLFVFLVFLIKT